MGNRDRNEEKEQRFNIGYLFFGTILIYLLIYLYMFFTSSHISGYEVVEGSLATNKKFSGLVLRSEEIVPAEIDGFIDYYAAAGSKVSAATVVYSIGKEGRMAEYLEVSSDEGLSREQINSLKQDVSSFSHEYDPANFSKVYNFHSVINGNILELTNQKLLGELNIQEAAASGNFKSVCAKQSGIIEYYIDDYEAVTPNQITPEMFDQHSYEPKNLRSENLVNQGDPVYKLITDENWYLIIPMTEEYLKEIVYENVQTEEGTKQQLRSGINVTFLKDKTTTWGYLSLLEVQGNQYLQVKFNNSVVRFSGERYLEVEFAANDLTGLKIPNSALTTKEFYVIPEEYVCTGGVNDYDGFTIQKTDESGNVKEIFVAPSFYAEINGMIYIDPNQGDFASNEPYIKAGDRVIKLDSQENWYVVGQTAELEGVYCINQGYTRFRKIVKLQQNEEYTIAQADVALSLKVYDRIVLDAAVLKEDQVIY